MMTPIETYLQTLDNITSREARHDRVSLEGEAPPIWVVTYEDWPIAGRITAFTYGLSSVDHPRWRLGRPELMTSVDSDKLAWGLAAGHLVRQHRGEQTFSYGEIYRLGDPIAIDSAMSCVLVFAPRDLPTKEAAQIQLVDRTINLVQMYPIYDEEAVLIKSIGLRDFLAMGVDFHHVRRPNSVST